MGKSPDRTLLPFAADSVWRLGIVRAATFAADTDARNSAIRSTGTDGSGKVWVNSGQNSHPIAYATDASLQAAVTAGATTWAERVPADARIAAGTDRHMHVIRRDGRYVQEHFLTTRSTATSYTVARRAEVDLDGGGIGPSNGVRAYGGSAIGGLIRGWEVDPGHPQYTGRIRHPLAIALRPDQLRVDPVNGTAGFVWPATEQDRDAATSYTGAVPMGSYFAIPPAVDLTTLGLQTPEGMMLAVAARDYGCYVTDRSGAQAFYCEDDAGPAAMWAATLLGGSSFSAHDPRVVFNALRVVTSNAAATPNGGPLGASRRG